MNPSWYGLRYPSLEDLEKAAEDLGCRVGYADIGEDAIYIAPDADYGEPPVILIPTGIGLLRQAWLMAHELAHLVRTGAEVCRNPGRTAVQVVPL